MNPFSGASWSATTFAFGLGVATKATVILMIVLLIQNLLRRRSAFLASAVANAGLVGLLLLPVAALAFPAVPIACLPAWDGASRSSVRAVPEAPLGPAGRTFRPTMSFRLSPNSMTLRPRLIP